MTYRVFTKLQCPCGHVGQIVESENDQPFSREWSRTSLRDLDNKGDYSGKHGLISRMKPSCPKCGTSLTPEHIISESI
ncbi:hypothetical protein [Vibrio sp. HN007]|uniref:hypothetical protein n=1 Tax=Vibrio iocasae TaxID=3098914 RepID=UPI0035D4E67C